MFKLHMTQHIVMSAPFRPPSKATAPKTHERALSDRTDCPVAPAGNVFEQ